MAPPTKSLLQRSNAGALREALDNLGPDPELAQLIEEAVAETRLMGAKRERYGLS